MPLLKQAPWVEIWVVIEFLKWASFLWQKPLLVVWLEASREWFQPRLVCASSPNVCVVRLWYICKLDTGKCYYVAALLALVSLCSRLGLLPAEYKIDVEVHYGLTSCVCAYTSVNSTTPAWVYAVHVLVWVCELVGQLWDSYPRAERPFLPAQPLLVSTDCVSLTTKGSSGTAHTCSGRHSQYSCRLPCAKGLSLSLFKKYKSRLVTAVFYLPVSG